MIEFQWEREAMAGNPTPKNLSLTDQKAYQALASLYGRYRMGLIDRPAGSIEKSRILSEWNKEKRMDEMTFDLAKWHIKLREKIGGAQSCYRKERTLENANKLSRILDGILEED